MKEVLIKEYGDDNRFHERPEKNKSEFVYDTEDRVTTQWSNTQFFWQYRWTIDSYLALQLSKDIEEVTALNWCPAVEEFREEESVSQVLLK